MSRALRILDALMVLAISLVYVLADKTFAFGMLVGFCYEISRRTLKP